MFAKCLSQEETHDTFVFLILVITEVVVIILGAVERTQKEPGSFG